MPVLTVNKYGLYCPQADVYIDPWRKVDRAIITHGHADHARSGMKHYLCQELTKPILHARIGRKISVEPKKFGETFEMNGVKISLHPAAHILGSAQVRLEYKGEIWVASGDYKTEDDGLSGAFEPVKCNHFISECTFGLPIYQFPNQAIVAQQMNDWVEENMRNGEHSVFLAYSLGKAQRIMHMLDEKYDGKIIAHGSVQKMNDAFIAQGVPLKNTKTANASKDDRGIPQIIIAPPNVRRSDWFKKFTPAKYAFCSGWMQSQNRKMSGGFDKGFILSDHADWDGLNYAIKETGAENIYLTHGSCETMARWVNEEMKLNGVILETLYEDDES